MFKFFSQKAVTDNFGSTQRNEDIYDPFLIFNLESECMEQKP